MAQDFAHLVGSRICHDLISPIGAIGNGLELLAMTQNGSGDEIGLVTESAESASARIRFFRIVYGNAAPEQMISRSEVHSVLGAADNTARFRFEWQSQANLRRIDVRIVFLVIQCIETATPSGGDISVTEQDGHWAISVKSRGPFRFDSMLWETLTSPVLNYEFTSAQVQFALLPAAIREAGKTLRIQKDDALTIQF